MFTHSMNSPQDLTESDGSVSFEAPGKTDYFVDPVSGAVTRSAPFYYVIPPEAFTFTARVSPAFAATYDAGALFYYAEEHSWVKLAFENTDMAYPAVVSVVTRGKSDDCNGEPVRAGSLWLRMSGKDDVLGLYYSLDGVKWKMQRLLSLEVPRNVSPRLGLVVQSPTGEGCRAVFDHIELTDTEVRSFRSGE